MNKSYLRRKPRQSTLFAVITILAAARILFSFDPIGSFLSTAAEPIKATLQSIGLKTDESRFDDYQSRADADELKKLQAENNDLREQLNLQQSLQKTDFINASVVSSTLEPFQRRVVIDKGANQGLQVDMAVTSFGYLVGQVASVTEESAVVMLINDSQFRAAVNIEGQDIDALLTNTATGTIIAQVPDAINLEEGSLVTTSGLGELFTSGFSIGQIGARIDQDQSIFSSYNLRLPVSTNDLDYVQIIIDGQGSSIDAS